MRPSLGFSLLLLAAVVACGDPPAAPTVPDGPSPSDPRTLAGYVPPISTDEWETVSPAALGWDTTALNAALTFAGQQQSTGVVMLWRGRIVAERYWNGWTSSKDSIIASAGKSVTSFLIGQLQEQGRLDITRPVSAYLGAGWSRSPSSESRITVRHLLSMTSGLDDSLRFVLEPGVRFYYNNPAYYQTFELITRASGQTMSAVSNTLLFDRIGMRTASWRFNLDTGEPGFVLSCSTRDMARYGLLVLNRGRWGSQTLLADTAYLTASMNSSQTSNPSYGFLWWLNGKASYRLPGPYVLPSVGGALIPSAPTDLVAALGKGDKKIYVIPSLELVVVRHGNEADASGGNPLAVSAFDEQFWQRLRLAIKY
jgi:CubicO group peptidase (beta-lactamase class C family)